MDVESLRLLSDNELNDMSAIKVMGWNCNIVNRVVQVWSDVMGRQIKVASDWNPTTDMNDAMELLEGKEYTLKNRGEIEVQIFKTSDDGKFIFYATSTTLPRAITIASILAKEE